jgi:hypothetical protein
MKYRISQTHERIGDPCSTVVATSREAEAAADKLRTDIAEMVAGWKIDPVGPQATGWSDEVSVWQHAEELAEEDGGTTYGKRAGDYIANNAVCIEEIEE